MKSQKQSPLLTLLCFCLVLAANNSARADLKVEKKPQWGFDGTIEVENFNLLSVEVFNDSEKPWQGSVWIKPIVGIQPVDVPIMQPDLFIEPYGTRKIQFYVFLPDRTEYEFNWGIFRSGRLIAENKYMIDSPKINDRELTVQLTNADAGIPKSKVPTFDEQLFPSSATVLGPLQGIVLDHAPRWQNPQTQAFRDWLFGGGTLYLVNSNPDVPLEFPTSLAELNEPSDEFPVGYGRVIRSVTPIVAPEAKKKAPQNYKNFSPSGSIFAILKRMTTPEHNWELIYFMAVVYLLILFPGCWLIGRKKGDFRLTYTVVLGTVALFSFGFHSIGKRGYGEETTINSVAIVKPGQPGRWVVEQWSNLFITAGGDYLIEHEVDSNATTTGQHTEAVRGIAINQPAAAMQTDIPSFSNRTILHTGIMKSPGFRPEMTKINVDNKHLEEFELSLPEGEIWPDFEQKVVIFRGSLFQLNLTNGKLVKAGSATSHLAQLEYNSLVYNPYRWGNENESSPAELYDKTFWQMIAKDLNLFYGENLNDTTLPENLIKVYLFTEMDSKFFAKGEISPQQAGKVLYSFEFHTTPAE